MSREDTLVQRFLDDTKNHVMKIIREDGIYRHIRFGVPGSSYYQYDLVTWPGHLCMVGDMGEWVFERTEDMFYFFKRPDSPYCNEQKVYTNPQYWMEKLRASKNPPEAWNLEYWTSRVRTGFADYYDVEESEIEAHEEWESFQDDVIGASVDERTQEVELYDALQEWKDSKGKQPFQDAWEWDFNIPTDQYMWAIMAISWGIETYFKSKESAEA